MAKYRHKYAAFNREVLNASWMEALMLEHAERGKVVAEAIAPDATPFGVGYKYSFEVSSGKHGGIHHDRAYGRLENTDPDALVIEYGSREGIDSKGRKHGATPAHRTLGRASDAMG